MHIYAYIEEGGGGKLTWLGRGGRHHPIFYIVFKIWVG
jgi:hypothetical protein